MIACAIHCKQDTSSGVPFLSTLLRGWVEWGFALDRDLGHDWTMDDQPDTTVLSQLFYVFGSHLPTGDQYDLIGADNIDPGDGKNVTVFQRYSRGWVKNSGFLVEGCRDHGLLHFDSLFEPRSRPGH